MRAQLNPYLSFNGQATEAMDFYASVFGGTVDRMTFGAMPDMPGYDESLKDLVMHSALSEESAVNLMGSDQPEAFGGGSPNGTISLSGDDEETLRGWWDKLGDGGQVTMPLDQAPWGDFFGQLTDKFGVPWMFNITGPDNRG